jgi:hypothetical protein
MRAMLLTVAFSVNLLAGQKMNVAICNLGGVDDAFVFQAKAETDQVYGSAGIRITWYTCEEFPTPAPKDSAPWFVIRLRNDKPPRTAGPASLDVMGKAYVEDNGGYMADAYWQAIALNSAQHEADGGALLGFVMAHELGHLLLGPGHTPDGVMQAAWGQKQMDALRRRWLKFGKESAKRIQRALDARTGQK